jgi:hypothetical protein
VVIVLLLLMPLAGSALVLALPPRLAVKLAAAVTGVTLLKIGRAHV